MSILRGDPRCALRYLGFAGWGEVRRVEQHRLFYM